MKDEIHILAVDFGNEESVSKSVVQQLDPQFLYAEPFAIECSLIGATPQAFWDERDIQLFKFVIIIIIIKGIRHENFFFIRP